MNTYIANKAMLVTLNISQWTGRKNDKRITKEIGLKYGVKDLGDTFRSTFYKCLIGKEAMDTITKTANAARTDFYFHTLPWKDDGTRILLSSNFMKFTEIMRGHREAFETAVNAFVDNYPQYIEVSRNALSGIFDPNDYPAISAIRRKFSFSFDINPVPTSGDFRVDLQQEAADAIKKEIESRNDTIIKDAMADVWQRLYKTVSRIAERLKDPKAIFRDTLIDNAVELCEILPGLNLTGDAELDRMRHEIESKLCTYDPQTLRDDKAARADVAKSADDIMSAMAGYMGN